jgi:hypothetical protein
MVSVTYVSELRLDETVVGRERALSSESWCVPSVCSTSASAAGREILTHIVINVETLLSPEDNKFGSEDERG